MAKRRFPRRPSPALLVGTVALLMSLTGTTFAVTSLPSRSVGSQELKRGAVRTENIAHGAVTVQKLGASYRIASAAAARSGTGLRADTSYAVRADYSEEAGKADKADRADRATLADTAGTAPSAASAASVGSVPDTDKLDGLDSSSFVAKSRLVDLGRFTLGDDEEQSMLVYGAFTVTARCFIGQLATDDADILISTTEPHSAFHGFLNDADLNPGEPQAGRLLIGVDGPTGLPQFESSARGTAVAPDGTEIRSLVLYTGLNLFGQPGRCAFGGLAIL